MGTFTSRIVIVTLLVLLGLTTCSATRSLLFPYPYDAHHGGYGGGNGGLGGGFPGFGGGYGGYGGGFPGFGGGFGGYGGGYPGFGGGYGGGYPGFGGGYGGIKKDVNVGVGTGSGNELERKTGSSGEGTKKGPNGLAEGLGFSARGHEKKGGVGSYHENGEKGGFGGPGFGGGCGHKSEVVEPGITP
jgi:hypothetical protein